MKITNYSGTTIHDDDKNNNNDVDDVSNTNDVVVALDIKVDDEKNVIGNDITLTPTCGNILTPDPMFSSPSCTDSSIPTVVTATTLSNPTDFSANDDSLPFMIQDYDSVIDCHSNNNDCDDASLFAGLTDHLTFHDTSFVSSSSSSSSASSVAAVDELLLLDDDDDVSPLLLFDCDTMDDVDDCYYNNHIQMMINEDDWL